MTAPPIPARTFYGSHPSEYTYSPGYTHTPIHTTHTTTSSPVYTQTTYPPPTQTYVHEVRTEKESHPTVYDYEGKIFFEKKKK